MKTTIIKPIITEKANKLSETANRYTFKVAKDANKIEIGRCIQKMYGVTVLSVNTMRVPSKTKSRMTKSGNLVGRKDAYKKAVVTISKDQTIDIYGNV